MKKSDFTFTKFEPKYEDYWFEVSGETCEELTEQFMEMCMLGVTGVVYSVKEDSIGIKELFPFSCDVVIAKNEENEELHKILKELVNELKSR